MSQSHMNELMQQARFVFRGTVQQLGATTMKSVPISARTAIVQVDQLIQAPEALQEYLGQEITVHLRGRRKLKQGQQAIFYTNGWLFGESIAVQSIAEQPLTTMPEALLRQSDVGTAAPSTNLTNRDLQQRLAQAQTVVTGRVTDIRLPRSVVAGALLRALNDGESPSNTMTGPISEHDPEWREAVIEVTDVEKGITQPTNVVVLFASSNDVQWYTAPKFEAGQEGVFLLHAAPSTDSVQREALLLPDASEPVFMALDPVDYQPPQQLSTVKTLIANLNE